MAWMINYVPHMVGTVIYIYLLFVLFIFSVWPFAGWPYREKLWSEAILKRCAGRYVAGMRIHSTPSAWARRCPPESVRPEQHPTSSRKRRRQKAAITARFHLNGLTLRHISEAWQFSTPLTDRKWKSVQVAWHKTVLSRLRVRRFCFKVVSGTPASVRRGETRTVGQQPKGPESRKCSPPPWKTFVGGTPWWGTTLPATARRS